MISSNFCPNFQILFKFCPIGTIIIIDPPGLYKGLIYKWHLIKPNWHFIHIFCFPGLENLLSIFCSFFVWNHFSCIVFYLLISGWQKLKGIVLYQNSSRVATILPYRLQFHYFTSSLNLVSIISFVWKRIWYTVRVHLRVSNCLLYYFFGCANNISSLITSFAYTSRVWRILRLIWVEDCCRQGIIPLLIMWLGFWI